MEEPMDAYLIMENPMTLGMQLWQDDSGFIVSIELILISTIAIIGLITGLTALRDAVISELSDTGGTIQDLNQGYSYNGVAGHSASTSGSSWADRLDWCDDREDAVNRIENCITVSGVSDEL